MGESGSWASGDLVEVFCRGGCGRCAAVQRWLTSLGVAFALHDVTTDSAAAQRLAGLGFQTLPVLLTADARAAAGSDPKVLAEALPLLADPGRMKPRGEEPR